MTLCPPSSGSPHLLQRVRNPRWGPWSCWDQHSLPGCHHHLIPLPDQALYTPLPPREPRPLWVGLGGGLRSPLQVAILPAPCTQHMNRCLKLLELPAGGDPSSPALPGGLHSFTLRCCTWRAQRALPPPALQPPAGWAWTLAGAGLGPGRPLCLGSSSVSPTWG